MTELTDAPKRNPELIFAEILRKKLVRKGITTASFAKMLGVDLQFANYILAGQVPVTYYVSIHALNSWLKLSPNHLAEIWTNLFPDNPVAFLTPPAPPMTRTFDTPKVSKESLNVPVDNPVIQKAIATLDKVIPIAHMQFSILINDLHNHTCIPFGVSNFIFLRQESFLSPHEILVYKDSVLVGRINAEKDDSLTMIFIDPVNGDKTKSFTLFDTRVITNVEVKLVIAMFAYPDLREF